MRQKRTGCTLSQPKFSPDMKAKELLETIQSNAIKCFDYMKENNAILNFHQRPRPLRHCKAMKGRVSRFPFTYSVYHTYCPFGRNRFQGKSPAIFDFFVKSVKNQQHFSSN